MPDLRLPEVLDQRGAQAVAAQLHDHLGQPVTVDAGALRRLGAVGAEMLIAAQRQWQADGVAFGVTGWPPEALSALAVLGLDPGDFTVEGRA